MSISERLELDLAELQAEEASLLSGVEHDSLEHLVSGHGMAEIDASGSPFTTSCSCCICCLP